MGIIAVPELVAGAIVGTNIYALTVANSKIHVVDFAVPAAMVETANYQLNVGAFAVNQKDPSAIVSYPAGNRIYVQNASEGLPADMVLASYDVTNPLAITQDVAPAPLNFGPNLFIGANGGCALAINYPIIYSLLGGNITTTAAQLNAIDATNLNVIGGPVAVGTFADRPIKLARDGQTLYVLSGTAGTANQKVFVYDISDPLNAPVLVTTLAISNANAIANGVSNFFVADNTISIITGGGLVDVHLVIYSTAGVELGSALVATGGTKGSAIAQAVGA